LTPAFPNPQLEQEGISGVLSEIPSYLKNIRLPA